MKRSYCKNILCLSALIVLVSLLGGAGVKAQEQNGACGEVAQSTAGPSVPGVDGVLSSDKSAAVQWYTVAGTSFIPSSDTMTWSYDGAGCIAPSATGSWRASVNIPDGSVINYMNFGYRNTGSSVASTAYLSSYNAGVYLDFIFLSSLPGSTTGAGYYYVGGAPASALTIDNQLNAYEFVWSGSATQRLCYMQVSYSLPTSTTTSTVAATTTTAPAAETTTTTTTGGKLCPAKKVLGENNPELEQLCDFRDSYLAKSTVGRRLISLYYNNADGINAVLERSPVLRGAARRLLEVFAPMVEKK